MNNKDVPLQEIMHGSKDEDFAEILAVFPTAPIPSPSILLENDNYAIAEAGLIRDFSNRSWVEMTVKCLRVNYDALSILSVPSLAYYVPAFMVGSLIDPIEMDVATTGLCSTLTPRMDRMRCRDLRDLLTIPQRRMAARILFRLVRYRPFGQENMDLWLQLVSDFWLNPNV